jgi:hypothetical protein
MLVFHDGTDLTHEFGFEWVFLGDGSLRATGHLGRTAAWLLTVPLHVNISSALPSTWFVRTANIIAFWPERSKAMEPATANGEI